MADIVDVDTGLNVSLPSAYNYNKSVITNSTIAEVLQNQTERGENGEKDNSGVYYASNFTSFGFIILVIVVIYFWRRYQKKNKEQKSLTKKEVTAFLEGSSAGDKKADDLPYSNISYDKTFEIKIDDLQIDESILLGVGEYGMVFKGTYNSTKVAVKTLKPNANLMYFKSLLSELKIMIFIGKHDNIIQCVGAHTGEISFRKLYVIVEYCELGSLEGYLRANRSAFDVLNYQNLRNKKSSADSMNKRDLLNWSAEISNGMEYLAEKKVVHGDLASRNVLLDKDKTAKITDFGLSRQIFNCSNYVKTSSKENPLPWRWLAIETMKELNFSTKSDVWSFGITMWEIFSLAQVPYPGLNYSHQFIKMLEDGLRMKKPGLCSDEIYTLMAECWNKTPDERPDFSVLHKRLNILLSKHP